MSRFRIMEAAGARSGIRAARVLGVSGCLALAAFPRASAAEPARDGARSTAVAGYCLLDMAERGAGHESYAGFRYRPRGRSLLYAEGRYLDRFDRREARLLGGGAYEIAGPWIVSAEISLAPGAEIYPRAAGWIELGRSVSRSLALSGRINGSSYHGAGLIGGSLAGEYYPRGDCALIARAGFVAIDFEGAPGSTDASGLLKVMWFVNERTRAFAYGAAGSESFRIENAERTGDIRSNVLGVGGVFYPFPAVAVSPSFEYQKRDRGPRFLQFAIEVSLDR